jgi:hypothetical protein
VSWLQKLLPPRIKSNPGERRTPVPEGLWVKCPSCEATLYRTDLEKNLHVCPKCSYHNRIAARERIEQLLDTEGRFEIGSEVLPMDSLKFRDQKKYPERLEAALEATGETDALVVMQGSIRSVPLVLAAFEFEFMGGSMGSVVGEGRRAHRLDGIRIPHQHDGRGRVACTERAYHVQHVAQADALREGALGRPLDDGPVGHRIGERDAELEDVGAAGDERMQDAGGGCERGIADRDVRDQRGAPAGAQRGERGVDAVHAPPRAAGSHSGRQ